MFLVEKASQTINTRKNNHLCLSTKILIASLKTWKQRQVSRTQTHTQATTVPKHVNDPPAVHYYD